MNTIYTLPITEIKIEESDYNFQEILTPILDEIEGDFSQDIINQIVLWKVNRYASIDATLLDKLNNLNKLDKEIDIEFTRQILDDLLNTKGIQLPMASTILRFKNPHIYQIIDQRVYRFIMGEEINEPHAIHKKIDYYFDYLEKLKSVCKEFNIDFNKSDRILYVLDKKSNSDKSLKNY
jgi:thermostable 8-oxoguanine DNA glycosylase